VSAGLAEIAAGDLDLDATLGCGQVFHWVREGAGWLGAVGDAPVYLEQNGGRLLVSAGSAELAATWRSTIRGRKFARASPPTRR
jgi:hypothetical protein